MNEKMKTLMTPEEVATYLGIKVRTIYSYAQTGGIPAIKLGGQWRFRKEDIDRWIDSQATGGDLWNHTAPSKSEDKRSLTSEIEIFITDEISRNDSSVLGNNGVDERLITKKIKDEFRIMEDSNLIKEVFKNLKKKKLIKTQDVKITRNGKSVTITMLKQGGK